MEQNENTTENANGTQATKKSTHVYDVKTMSVVAFGGYKFTYSRFASEIKEMLEVYPQCEEVFNFALKGFIDDLQDCTASSKKGNYRKTPEGEDSYRVDCLNKRRELEGHINAGTRPARANENPEAKQDKALGKAVKEQAKVISLEGLLTKKAMKDLPGAAPFTADDEAKLKEFMAAAFAAMNNG